MGTIVGAALIYFIMVKSPFFQEAGGRVYKITNCEELQAMNDDLDGVYIVMNDIDCKNFNGELK